MLICSDGRTFVYALTVTDLECGTLHSLHESEESARAEWARIQADPDLVGPLGLYGNHAACEIDTREVQS